jgi:hypothetical protein
VLIHEVHMLDMQSVLVWMQRWTTGGRHGFAGDNRAVLVDILGTTKLVEKSR